MNKHLKEAIFLNSYANKQWHDTNVPVGAVEWDIYLQFDTQPKRCPKKL